ncbi:hypothetical protein [Dactylosporangium sp. CA-092794]|uniref:hypothetical protein n=1 Tax=Dactylosporangium sp. CA-092794 TaxID=3239929 RepID=UPI003D8B4894
MPVDVSQLRRIGRQLPDAFRLPTEADPRPANRHIAAVCAWAAALGLGGMAVALRAFVGLIAQYRGWYGPTVVTVGLLGLACTIGAFASVHRRRLPFALLGAASVSLLIGWVITGL